MPLTTTVTDWIDKELAADPAFAQDVEAELEAMRVEQALVALRQARGVSQRQLARMLGVKQPVIAKLESGRARNVGLRTIVRAVRALGGRIHLDIKPVPAKARLRPAAKRAMGHRKSSARRSSR